MEEEHVIDEKLGAESNIEKPIEQKIKILIVEDEAITSMDMQKYLQKIGYSVPLICSSGEEAILLAKELKPDLILMDIFLKGKIDGTTAAKHITDLYNIPIIFITAYSDDDTIHRVKQSVPYAYIIKPYEARYLRTIIELTLIKKHTECLLEKKKLTSEKNALLNILNHEIRTPLNGLMAMSELLLGSDNLTCEQRAYLKIIRVSEEQLLFVLNEILDFSRLNNIFLENVAFDISHLMEELKTVYAILLNDKKIQLHLQMDTNVPKKLFGDPLRIRQILNNFINCAIKNIKQGTVELKILLQEKNEKNIVLSFVILACPNTQNRPLLDTQENNMESSLGLTISKKLIELLGGTMNMGPTTDAALEFSFTAPLVDLTENTAILTENASSQQKQAKILVAEDNPINQQVVIQILKKLGYQTDIAENGLEALQAMKDNTYDLVLMDCQMPEIDGYTTTQIVRKLEKEQGKKSVPIIAVTANTLKKEREKCLAAGMNDFISKPINVTLFAEKLSYWLKSDR